MEVFLTSCEHWHWKHTAACLLSFQVVFGLQVAMPLRSWERFGHLIPRLIGTIPTLRWDSRTLNRRAAAWTRGGDEAFAPCRNNRKQAETTIKSQKFDFNRRKMQWTSMNQWTLRIPKVNAHGGLIIQRTGCLGSCKCASVDKLIKFIKCLTDLTVMTYLGLVPHNRRSRMRKGCRWLTCDHPPADRYHPGRSLLKKSWGTRCCHKRWLFE